jgi:hypothetical protein
MSKASVTKTLVVSTLLLSGGIGLSLAQDDPSYFPLPDGGDPDYDPDFADPEDYADDGGNDGDDGGGDFEGGWCESFDWTDGRHGMDISTHALSNSYGPNDPDTLCELITDLSNQGVRVLAINAAYSDGDLSQNYNFDSWGNMVIDDLYTPNAAFNNDWDSFGQVMECAHDACMKVVSWWNPSYVYPTSWLYANPDNESYYRFAEKEDNECAQARNNGCYMSSDVDQGYFGVPAMAACLGNPSSFCDCEWVYDESKDKCYASVWGGAPSGDFWSDDWTDYVYGAMEMYLQNGLDGFVLDAPNYYVGVGTFDDNFSTDGPNGDLLYEKLIQPLKENYQPLIFGETYGFPLFQRVAGLDGDFTEYGKIYGDDALLNNLIESQDPGSLYGQFIFDGQDHAVTYCHLGTRLYDERDGHCPMNIVRLLPDDVDDWSWGTNRLARALTTGAGFLTDVYMNSESPPYCDGIDSGYCAANWWKPQAYLGQDDQKTNDFLAYAAWGSDDADAGPWGPQALRAPGLYDDRPVYTMLKYDAFDSGRFGVFAANLGDDQVPDFDLGGALYTDTLRDFTGSDQVDGSQFMDSQDFLYEEFPGPLASWSVADGTLPGLTNCYDEEHYQIMNEDGSEQMTLGACLLRCLANEDNDCNMVVVGWDEWQDKGLIQSCHANPKSAEELYNAGSCYSCDDDEENCGYTTLSHSWAQ